VFELEITIAASFFRTSQAGAMLAMPPKDPVSSTAVQHSDGVSNTHIRRVDHHAEIPRESYVEFTTLERTSLDDVSIRLRNQGRTGNDAGAAPDHGVALSADLSTAPPTSLQEFRYALRG
jgi:D-mannonate dehydratase